MDRLRQYALVAGLAHNLRKEGSWCGETHLQKAMYFLQRLERVPVGFDFFLYKHGPFSFDLRDGLTAMRFDGILDLRPQWPYGPSFVPTERGDQLRKHYSRTLKKYQRQLSFVGRTLGSRNVADLEKLATALYITLEDPRKPDMQRAKILSSLKPHISGDDALAAMKKVDEIIKASKQTRAS